MTARALRRAVAALALLAVAGHAAPVSAPPPPVATAFRAPLAAKAPLLAIARAGGRLVTAGDFGIVLLSDDDGRTWRQAQSVATRQMLTSLAFLDAQKGFAVGHGGTVLATADGGENWTAVHDAGADNVLLSVRFLDAQRGFVVGAFGFAIASDDGGRTWRTFVPGEGDDRDRHLNGVFAAHGALFIAAEAGTVFRSMDFGSTWTTLRLPYDGSLWGGLALDDGAVLVYGMRGHVLRSTDLGKQWSDIPTGTTQSWTAALHSPGGEIVLVGLGGTVALSRDGGRSFRSTTLHERQTFAAVAAGAPGQLVLAGLGGIETRPRIAP